MKVTSDLADRVLEDASMGCRTQVLYVVRRGISDSSAVTLQNFFEGLPRKKRDFVATACRPCMAG